MNGGNGADGYRNIWRTLQENGYKTRPFAGDHIEVLSPRGDRIGVYYVPETLPEGIRCQIFVDAVAEALKKHAP